MALPKAPERMSPSVIDMKTSVFGSRRTRSSTMTVATTLNDRNR